jgi:proteasome activator subunit 3 (PA28 gamma)
MKRSRGNEGKELDAKIEEFRTKMRDKSMDLFNVKFSEKLALLSSVFESELFCMDVAQIHNTGKKAKVEEGTFEEGTNEVLKKVVEIVKKELAEFVESVSTIKVWIQLLTPSIADGNNFGVSVQEECITEFARAEENAFSTLDTISKYYLQRAKLVTKRKKYPQIEDYARCIVETDEKVYVTLRLSLMDL